MGGLFGSKQTQTNNSYSNTNSSFSNTSTPNIPDWWMARYNGIDDMLDPTGRTANQTAVADFLRNNMSGNALGGAYGVASQATADALGAAGRYGGYIDGAANAAATGGQTVNGAVNFLQNQLNNGSYTLGHWFPEAVQATGATSANVSAAGAPAVAAGSGASYMGTYATPLSNDYVNASLADYDAGAAQGFNALRARNADAFGNKRTGVAEGQFMADAARGRGTLASDLRLKAFNTAAGFGQSDADRALAADTTTAGNIQNNNQFNAANALNNNQFNARQAQDLSQYNTTLTDSRQKFDATQAEAGDQRRTNVANNLVGAGAASGNLAAQLGNIGSAGVNAAAQRAALGAQGLDNAINLNAANLANANAVGNFDTMTLSQLYQLLNQGQAGIGRTESGTSNSATNSSGTTTTKSSPSPWSILSTIAGVM